MLSTGHLAGPGIFFWKNAVLHKAGLFSLLLWSNGSSATPDKTHMVFLKPRKLVLHR